MTNIDDRCGVVVFNPVAGRGHAARACQAAHDRLGARWEWRPTSGPGHAIEIARQAASEGSPVVVACGGDGTAGDVARGVVGSDTALGILPLGTGNDIARNLGIPIDDPVAACDIILSCPVRRIDMGSINGIPFINNAGTGFDARVMQTMNQSIRFLRGKQAFILATLCTFPLFQPFALTIERDDSVAETFPAMMVSVLNGAVYGGGMKACPAGRVDDEELDVLVLKAMSKLQLLALFPRVIAGTHEGHPAVRLFRASRLRLSCDPPQPLNIDGDVTGSTPAIILVQPAALNVISPVGT